MKSAAASTPTLMAISAISHPSGTSASSPGSTLPMLNAHTRVIGVFVRMLATVTAKNRFTAPNEKPAAAISAAIPNGSSGITALLTASTAAQHASVDST